MVNFVLFCLLALAVYAERVVIEGGGPIGLYAAVRLHEEGYSVTLLNDREEYTRLQIVGLDPPWVDFLRRFAGGEFSRLIRQGRARMTVTGSVEMILSDLERLLFQELKRQERRSSRLTLLSNRPVEGIKESDGEFFVKSGTLYIPFDTLLCAGGTRDRLVLEELSIPLSVHEPVPFTVEMFAKKWGGELPLSREEQAVTVTPNFRKIEETLRKEVSLIAESDLELARLYGFFAHHLASERMELSCRFFENGVEVAVAVEWGHPFFVSMFRLDRLAGISRESKEGAQRFFKCIHDEVVEAILFEKAVSKESLKPLALSHFFVQQTRLKEGERQLRGDVRLFAVGDALVTPHFFSRKGLELGRLSVENVLDRLKSGEKSAFEERRKEIEESALWFGKPERPAFEERCILLKRAEEAFKRRADVTGGKGRYLLRLGEAEIPFSIEIVEKEERLSPFEVSYFCEGESFASFGALLLAISDRISYTF